MNNPTRFSLLTSFFITVGLGLILCSVSKPVRVNAADSVQSPLLTVTQGTVQKVVPLAGTVMSQSKASIIYFGTITTVANVSVKTGTSVSQGQVLATMTNGTSLVAPFAGTIVNVALTAGDVVPGTASTQSGTQTSAQSPSSGSGRMGRAPANGQIVSNQAAPLSITVADAQNIGVQAQADQQTVHWIAQGNSAQLILPGEPGIIYTGAVTQVSHMAQTNSSSAVTYPVTISLTVPSGQPIPFLGMSVQAYVQVEKSSGVSVPIDALSQRADDTYVVTMASGEERVVRLGMIGSNQAIVTRGLTAGESIRLPVNATGLTNRSVTVMVLP